MKFTYSVLIKKNTFFKDKQSLVYSYLMKRLKESKVELVHIGSIFALREMHSVFGGEMFSEKDRKYLEQLKTKGATNTLRDEVENLINELEGRRYVLLLCI